MKGFNDLVRDQFIYGGQKYALSETRESTDQLFDDFGRNWLFGTMAKYCKRYKNLARERDILKIACYVYILWLKKGYHITAKGLTTDVLDTNVEQKAQNFDLFIKVFDEGYNTSFAQLDWYTKKKDELGKHFPVDLIYNELRTLAKREWREITDSNLRFIYGNCKLLWEMEYSKVAVHDTDIPVSKVEANAKK